jgi:DNA gyrase inhibitor GyrI
LTNGTINLTNATVSWTASGATSYNTRVRVAGTSWAGHNTTSSTSYTFNNLSANTNYEYQIRGICSGEYAGWSATQTFTTGASMIPILFEEVSAKAGFMVYPNPTRDQITIEFSTETLQTTKVKVLDMTGRVVKTVEAVPQAGEHQYTLSLSELSAGMYTVQVYTDDKLSYVTKVQKQD